MRLTYENPLRYGDYIIYYDYTEWGGRYYFVHTDYDGAPDANDNRIGNAETIEECIELIDELEN